MLRLARSLGHSSREERGFTLIETLVALVAGVAVMSGLFTILDVSLKQSTRVSDVVQASQLGRTAMTQIVDELHSACIASGFAPIQEGSNGSKLIFVTGYSEAAEIAEARKDEIVFSGETLTDNVYNSTGGTSPNFTFPKEKTKSILIAKNISQSSEGGKEVSVFRYYAYAVTPPSNEKTSEASSTLVLKEPPVGGGFTAAEAKPLASVLVSFKAGPVSTIKDASRKVELASQVTMAFSAPDAEATIEAAPCE
jgi:prepilin-type N-terminal cleavage/methylation domain-containing protein